MLGDDAEDWACSARDGLKTLAVVGALTLGWGFVFLGVSVAMQLTDPF